jgi:hypothetical protein
VTNLILFLLHRRTRLVDGFIKGRSTHQYFIIVFDILRLSLFNHGRCMSKFLPFLMGLETFIRIALLILLLTLILVKRGGLFSLL